MQAPLVVLMVVLNAIVSSLISREETVIGAILEKLATIGTHIYQNTWRFYSLIKNHGGNLKMARKMSIYRYFYILTTFMAS